MTFAWQEEHLRSAMARLWIRRPEDVLDMAWQGALPEPHCCVCTVLLPVVKDRLPGWSPALNVMMFHDEPTYDVAEDDYLMAIGLADILTYRRCLRVYEVAREVVAADALLGMLGDRLSLPSNRPEGPGVGRGPG